MKENKTHPVLPSDFHDRSPQEKRAFLENVADTIRDDRPVNRPLSDDEKTQLRYDLQQVTIRLRDIEAEYKDVQKDYREQINELKESIGDIISQLKQGFEEVHGTTYEIRDYDNERVFVLMSDGTEVDNRPLLPNERQHTIQTDLRKIHGGE